MKNITLILALFCAINLSAQLQNNDVYEMPQMDKSSVRENICIPDILGYQTLKCDFHIHTVFSDGRVWPDIRVDEAWSQGLDAIAITDHIEYRPHKDVLKGDLNESYKIAKAYADAMGFILVKGIEITRAKPLGHLNALFINDAMPLDVKDPLEVIDIAKSQGAFIMWNHPGWPNDTSTLYPVHEKLIKAGKINGIEVFNYTEYYPISFDWTRDMNLAFMANSDVHESAYTLYGGEKAARPMTLVFATERSEKGIKEALFAGRSVAYFKNELAGKTEFLKEIVLASIKIKLINEKEGKVELLNLSDINYKFKCNNNLIILPSGKTIRTSLPKTGKITVLNCHIGSNKKLEIELPLK